MAKKEQQTYAQIINDIKKGIFSPIYLLMGEEGYYIDQITKAIQEHALSDDERDFNEIVLYGAETTTEMIINESKYFPTFGNRRLVIVKEAQEVAGGLDSLKYYTTSPLGSTVLVINFRNGNADRRKKWVQEVEQCGLIFESKKLYDYQIPAWIGAYLGERGYQMETKAGTMLMDFLGSDLSKIVGELNKLIITLPEKEKRITAIHVERNIGISKDYNNFELQKAIVSKDFQKAIRIANYFGANPKANPVVVTLTVLFNYFTNLMIAYYASDKSEAGIMRELGLRNAFQAKDYLEGLRNYSAMQVFTVISLIREYDAKAKGFGSINLSNTDLLKELIFKIIH